MHFGRDPSEISESLKALYREEVQIYFSGTERQEAGIGVCLCP